MPNYIIEIVTPGPAGPPGDSIFADRAALAAASVPSPIIRVYVKSYNAAVGSGGGAWYKRVAAQPAHSLKVQDALLAWWEIDEPELYPEMAGARGDGVTDDTAAIQACLNHTGVAVLKSKKRYAITNLTLPDFGAIVSPDKTAELVFIGTAGAGIASADTATSLLYARLEGFKVTHAAGALSYLIDLAGPVGCKIIDCNIETTVNNVSGIRMYRIGAGPDASWVNNISETRVKLPDTGTGRPLNTESGDASILGSSFTGGIGSLIKCTGGLKVTGNRFDRAMQAATYALTLQSNFGANAQFGIVNNQIEECVNGILVDADTDDPDTPTRVMCNIVGNQFRCNDPSAVGPGFDITLLNAAGAQIISPPAIVGNAFTSTVSEPISYNPAHWTNVYIEQNTFSDIDDWEAYGSRIEQLLTAQSVGVGADYTISSATIAKKYRRLTLRLRQVSHNDAANQTVRIEISGNNGATWTAAQVVCASSPAATVISGTIEIDNCHLATGTRVVDAKTAAHGGTSSGLMSVHELTVATGYVNAIRLSPSAGSFDGGTVSLAGVN